MAVATSAPGKGVATSRQVETTVDTRSDMVAIPEDYHDLFEKPTFAHIGTVLPNGVPHVTPVWVDYDPEREHVLVNTERDRRKERNVRENPAVGVSMCDPQDPYRYLSVIGEVDEITTEGARAHIDELAQRYVGTDYQNPIETDRVLLRIRADRLV
jgi:PPOX class probable F420-dependent enzyme